MSQLFFSGILKVLAVFLLGRYALAIVFDEGERILISAPLWILQGAKVK